MAEKKVRVRNITTDGTSIRVFVIHLSPNIQAFFDVQPGGVVQNNHMTPGHRGVIVYDDFQETVIITSEFRLDALNMAIVISGSAGGGYGVSYETFP